MPSSTGGWQARRIQFWPVSGRARQPALNMPHEMVSNSHLVKDISKGAGVRELF
jgi:hypothetical protein